MRTCDCCFGTITSEKVYRAFDMDMCEQCVKENLIEVYYYSAKRKRDFYRYSGIDDEEFLAKLDEMTNDQLKEVMMKEDPEVILNDREARWEELE